MNILHCDTYNGVGGASVAACRICEAQKNAGLNARIASLCHLPRARKAERLVSSVRALGHTFASRLEKKLLHTIGGRPEVFYSMSLLPSFMHRNINAQHADIYHLHWVTDGFLSPFELARLKKPVVWTMHDMNPFTAACHYTQGCKQYTTGCQACPQVSRKMQKFVRYCFKRKQEAYARCKPVFVSPSKDFYQSARESALLSSYKVYHIPYAIDTHLFAPSASHTAREILHISQDAPLLAFGASALNDTRKGADLLAQALNALPGITEKNIQLLIFGTDTNTLGVPYPVHCLGQLTDAVALRLAYCAGDAFVCPSREYNLPNTVMESLACGTPVVGFEVGGIPDMVDDGINGKIVPVKHYGDFDPKALAHAIAYVLENTERHTNMRHAAREKVEKNYAMPIIAKQYSELYEEILARHR